MLPKIGDPAGFVLAISDQKILNTGVESIKSALKYAMLKIGLRAANWPNEEEKAVLVSHIYQNFPGHTPAEIRLAFDLAIAEKLDLKEVNCYENFSCLYLSSVMNSYRRWAVVQHDLLPKQQSNQKQLAAPKSLDDREVEEWVKETKTSNLKTALLPIPLYDILFLRGIITTKWDDQEWLPFAVGFRQAQLSSDTSKGSEKEFSEFMRMKEKSEFTGKEVDKIRDISKKIILKDYIQHLP